jgi:glycosyltransferase involved in cell wall biosynthesis
MVRISAVLPAFNEQDNIVEAIAELESVAAGCASEHEIIVVDDGSADRTNELVVQLAESDPRIRLVEHERNQGYGAALHSGFSAARFEWVFLTDADRQFEISELESFIPHCDTHDLILGYRNPRRDPFIRLLNAFGWNLLVNTLFGYTARDVDCAFKLFRRSIFDNMVVRSRGATLSTEFLVRSRRAGYRFLEQGVSHRPRGFGSATGAKPAVIVRAFRELIAFWLASRQERIREKVG